MGTASAPAVGCPCDGAENQLSERGRRTTKHAPPSSVLAASTEPPCADTISLTIARPRPAPPRPRARPPSARQKRWNRRVASPAGSPGPWSRAAGGRRSGEHTSELQSHVKIVCRLLLVKKKKKNNEAMTY